MRRDHPLAFALIIVPLLLAGCTQPGTAQRFELTEDFEQGLAGWTEGSDVPDDPNRPGEKVAWNITATTDRARSGAQSVNLSLDGSQDDGTIWITRSLNVREGVAYDVSFSVHAHSRSESFNTLAYLVGYLGTAAPTVEESFPAPGENEAGDRDVTAHGLRETLNQQQGWKAYTFNWTTPELTTDTLHVAVGISAVWETQMHYHVDDLELVLDPVSSDASGDGGDGGSNY